MHSIIVPLSKATTQNCLFWCLSTFHFHSTLNKNNFIYNGNPISHVCSVLCRSSLRVIPSLVQWVLLHKETGIPGKRLWCLVESDCRHSSHMRWNFNQTSKKNATSRNWIKSGSQRWSTVLTTVPSTPQALKTTKLTSWKHMLEAANTFVPYINSQFSKKMITNCTVCTAHRLQSWTIML